MFKSLAEGTALISKKALTILMGTVFRASKSAEPFADIVVAQAIAMQVIDLRFVLSIIQRRYLQMTKSAECPLLFNVLTH